MKPNRPKYTTGNVAIITIAHGTNYGNRLQNYALANTISKLGYEVETIPGPGLSFKATLRVIASKFKHAKNSILLHKAQKQRNKSFEKFNSSYINFSEYKSKYYKNLKKIDKEYDKFIIGSDQVWNPFAGYNLQTMFGYNLTPKKVSSYAASFGVSVIPGDYISEYSRYLKHPANISVREDQATDIIRKISNREAVKVADPTLLLTREEYSKISKKPDNIATDEPIIAVYSLGGLRKEIQNQLSNFAADNNMRIVDLYSSKSPETYTYSPSEFLYTIANSKLVVTDSYHACVFSIIFNSPFIVYDREVSENKRKMNSRIDTLLKDTALTSRRNIPNISLDTLNYSYTVSNSRIEKMKKDGIAYLSKCLSS